MKLRGIGLHFSARGRITLVVPQLEDKDPEYTPRSDNEMVNDNFDDKSEDDLQINCDIV